MSLNILLQNKKIMLSSKSRVYKTELFIKQTKNFKDLDLFLNKIAEGIILSKIDEKESQKEPDSYKIETPDKEHCLFFAFGKELGANDTLGAQDIVFFKYLGRESFVRRDDTRLRDYLSRPFNVQISPANVPKSKADFKKLYLLSNSGLVHFPLLNSQQNSLVQIENQNVLVQGTAGSGKTNICIDKIIFSACREYAGRVMYSTFSRGLLLNTQAKVKQFKQNLTNFVALYKKGDIAFADSNHKKAIENHLGLSFSEADDDKIILKIEKIAAFLEGNVDYFLLEDLYCLHINNGAKIESTGEQYFVKTYIKSIKNHQLTTRLDKIKYLSYEVMYKEIFGMITGCFNAQDPCQILTLEEYTQKRRDSFSRYECEIIYALAKDYLQHLSKNGLIDNNIISRQLIKKLNQIKKYSLIILDEVQDLTEVSLSLFKGMAIKLFCVGDALQMINPSYFSFAYLKRLLFEKDVVTVAELSHNYRSTRCIALLSQALGDINIKQFGTHSFVLKCATVESDVPTLTARVSDSSFLKTADKNGYNNYTVIVSSTAQKERLQQSLLNTEILTVAEIKGLERDAVVLHNVLSDNFDKWKALERMSINRKAADENSVYRYYFNLFYVAVSRAKTHIYAYEDKQIPLFKDFFKDSFKLLSGDEAAKRLFDMSDKTEAEQDRIIERIAEFIRLEQFDNARFWASKILTEKEKSVQLSRIEIYQSLVFKGKNKDAGIRLWQNGLTSEAREQFILADEAALLQLLDACTNGENKELGADIITFLPEVEANEAARQLIIDSVVREANSLNEKQKIITENLKRIKERANG